MPHPPATLSPHRDSLLTSVISSPIKYANCFRSHSNSSRTPTRSGAFNIPGPGAYNPELRDIHHCPHPSPPFSATSGRFSPTNNAPVPRIHVTDVSYQTDQGSNMTIATLQSKNRQGAFGKYDKREMNLASWVMNDQRCRVLTLEPLRKEEEGTTSEKVRPSHGGHVKARSAHGQMESKTTREQCMNPMKKRPVDLRPLDLFQTNVDHRRELRMDVTMRMALGVMS